jgi:hypothetical protein
MLLWFLGMRGWNRIQLNARDARDARDAREAEATILLRKNVFSSKAFISFSIASVPKVFNIKTV